MTSRGIERRAIFRDAGDEAHFVELLRQFPGRFGVRVVAYVLMGNHYHLVVQTPRANLSAAMQWLNMAYGVWFNRRHRRAGPLLQGRFRGILIENAGGRAYEVVKYVHLNPVRVHALGLGKTARQLERAGLLPAPTREEVERRLATLREHVGSSYPAYAGYRKAPEWLSVRVVLARTPGRGGDLTGRYRADVEETIRRGIPERPWAQLRAGLVLGTEAFARRIRLRGNRNEMIEVRVLERPAKWEEVLAAVERVKGERWVAFRNRHGDWGRDLALAAARRCTGLTLAALGEAAGGLRYAAVAQAIRTFEQRSRKDRARLRAWQRVMHDLNS